MKNQLESIIETLLSVKENDVLYCHEPILVRVNDFTPPFEIHALCVSPKKDLYVMEGSGDWHPLALEDMNADKMISAINKRFESTFKPSKA